MRQIGTRFFHKKHSEACEVSVFPCNPRLFQGFGQNKSMFLIVVFLIGKKGVCAGSTYGYFGVKLVIRLPTPSEARFKSSSY